MNEQASQSSGRWRVESHVWSFGTFAKHADAEAVAAMVREEENLEIFVRPVA